MSKIISISLTEEILAEIAKLEKDVGYSGRSEVIRDGIRALSKQESEFENLNGKIEGVLIITHEEKYSKEFSDIIHKFHDLVKTQIHHDIKDHKCLEILILNGRAKDAIKLNNALKTSKKIEFVKMVLA